MGPLCSTIPQRKKGVPATDFISAERKLTEVCAFARPLAELVAPPTMRHHAETSSTMIADLRLPHPILAQQFEGSCLPAWESQSCSSSSRCVSGQLALIARFLATKARRQY